jgi:murein DD-endopeptidase MepM/ murein hydrolase activator NlpD
MACRIKIILNNSSCFLRDGLWRLFVGRDIPPSTKWFFIAVLVSSLLLITSAIQASIEKLPDYPKKGNLSLPGMETNRARGGRVIYEVKNGDMLISILKRYNVSIGDALAASRKIDRKTLKKIKPGGEIDLSYSKDRTAILEIGYTFRDEKRKVLYSGKGLPVSALSQASVTGYNRAQASDPAKKSKKTSALEAFNPRPARQEKNSSIKIISGAKGRRPSSVQINKDILQDNIVPGPAELLTADLDFIPGMVPWEISDKSYAPLDIDRGYHSLSIFNAPKSFKNRLRNDFYKERLRLSRAKLAAMREFLKAPLAYRKITSKFAWRVNPITGNAEHHTGVDYAAPYGTPVKTIGFGKVIFTGWRNGYGKTIQVRHHNGYTSQYAHLSRFGKGITEGKAVKRGDIIGYVGSSGMSTGPHLDLRVMKSGAYINPLTLNKPLKHNNSKKYSSHKLRNKNHYQTNAKRRSKTTLATRR